MQRASRRPGRTAAWDATPPTSERGISPNTKRYTTLRAAQCAGATRAIAGGRVGRWPLAEPKAELTADG